MPRRSYQWEPARTCSGQPSLLSLALPAQPCQIHHGKGVDDTCHRSPHNSTPASRPKGRQLRPTCRAESESGRRVLQRPCVSGSPQYPPLSVWHQAILRIMRVRSRLSRVCRLWKSGQAPSPFRHAVGSTEAQTPSAPKRITAREPYANARLNESSDRL